MTLKLRGEHHWYDTEQALIAGVLKWEESLGGGRIKEVGPIYNAPNHVDIGDKSDGYYFRVRAEARGKAPNFANFVIRTSDISVADATRETLIAALRGREKDDLGSETNDAGTRR